MSTGQSALHAPLTDHHTIEKRIDATTWGLLFLMTGLLMFLPGRLVPEGAWLILAGFILVAMSAARYLNHLKASGFIIALGVLGIVGGISSAAGLHFPFFAAFLVLVGGVIVARSWLAHSDS